MEEKIYFKPGKYGKGTKKQKINGGGKKLIKLLVFLFILGGTIFAIAMLLKGNTITSGDFPGPTKSDYLVCQKKNPEYGIIELRNPLESEAKVTFLILESGAISSASLTYTSSYENERDAYDSRNVTNGAFNNALTDSGFGTGAFSNKFTLYDNKLIITLAAPKGEITEKSAKFFMMKNVDNFDFMKATVSDYQKIYEQQGFFCETSLEK